MAQLAKCIGQFCTGALTLRPIGSRVAPAGSGKSTSDRRGASHGGSRGNQRSVFSVPEVMGLKWDAVDLERGEVKVQAGRSHLMGTAPQPMSPNPRPLRCPCPVVGPLLAQGPPGHLTLRAAPLADLLTHHIPLSTPVIVGGLFGPSGRRLTPPFPDPASITDVTRPGLHRSNP